MRHLSVRLLALLCLSVFAPCPFVHGQAVTAVPIAVNQAGLPMGTTLVTICSANPGAGTCPSLATTYTDISLAHVCTGTLQLLNNSTNPAVGSGCSNPGYSDSLGNVVAYGAPGSAFFCQYSGPTTATYSQPCPSAGATGSGVPGTPLGAIQGNNAGSFGGIPGTSYSPSNGIVSLAITGPRPYIDVTSPLYNADPLGISDSSAAFNNADAACPSGGVVLVPPGTYTFTAPFNPTTACVFFAEGGATLQLNNPTTTATQTVGRIQIATSNFTLQGFTINGENGTNAGNCIVAAGPYTNILIQNNVIKNCDGTGITFAGATIGAAGPSNSQIIDNTITNTMVNAGLSFGPIYLRDGSNDVLIQGNYVDGSPTRGAGAATIQCQSQGLTSAINNLRILNNHLIAAADWAIQCGHFNSYMTVGLIIANNVMEELAPSVGFISIYGTHGAVVTGNSGNSHFVDLMYSGSDGTTNGTTTFTTTSATFTPNMTGRTLVCDVCGVAGAPLETTVTYVSSNTLTLGTAATNSASGLTWHLFGYSLGLAAIEVAGGTGDVIADNAFAVEGSGNNYGIDVDGGNGSQITGNNVIGFGETGGVGIILQSALPMQPIVSATQSGYVVTVTTSSATGCTANQLCPEWQPGITMAICNNSHVCTPGASSYNGIFEIQNTGYSRTGQTFTYIDVAGKNMASCSAANCAFVQMSIADISVVGNHVYLPFANSTSGNIFGLQTKTQSSTSQQWNFGNSFRDNQVFGGGPVLGGSSTCASITGNIATVDSQTFSNNTCTNTNTGINRNFGTNSRLIDFVFNGVAVANQFVGTAQTGEYSHFLPPTISPTCSFVTGGGTGPSCSFSIGSTFAQNDRGVIILTTGTAPGSTGTVTLTFGAKFGINQAVCEYQASDGGSATWANGAVIKDLAANTTSDTFTWTNIVSGTPTTLSASATYWINYHCIAN